MKTFLTRCIFFFLLFSVAKSDAQSTITGSDTVCAGYRYSYKVIMPGAVTFTWTLPNGWYFLYGQGTDSVFVTCNVNVGYVVVVGFDTAAVPIGTDSIQVTWGLGGDVWHLQGTQTWIPPCYCYSYWIFEIIVDTLLCQGSCGDAVQNPYLYAALFNGPIPSYTNYLGPLDSTTAVTGPANVYGYFIDTTFGLANLIVISGGVCGSGNNAFSIPADPPCTFWIGLQQNPDPICVGDTFTVSVGWWWMYYYSWSSWSSNITFIGPTNGPTVTAVLTAPGWAYIDFFGGDWCYTYYGSLTVNYTYCGPPIVSFSANPTTVCTGSCRTFNNSSQYATSYQWSFPGGTPSTSTSTNPTVCYSTPGQYSVTLTAFNSYGSQTLTQTNYITVNPSPNVYATPSFATICYGQSVLLSASGATTYTWSPSSSLIPATGPNVTATPYSTTTYTVTGSQNGCTASSWVTVTVNPLPVVTVSPSQAICTGQTAVLNVSGAASYAWSPSATLNSSTSSSVIASPTSTTTYVVTGMSANNGCTATSQTTVTVNPIPAVSVSPDDTVCIGQNTVLSAWGANTYSWSPSASLSSSTGSTVTASPSATTTYTVTGSSLGCSATQQVTITVSPLPVLSVSPDDTICTGQSTTLNVTGAGSYMWSPSSSLNSSTAASVTANPSSTTTYTVTGDLLGCTASSQVTVTVNPVPVISVSPNVTICSGQSTALTTSGANAYSWSPSASLSSSTSSTVTATPSSTTTYTVTGNLLGCTASQQVTVVVNPLPAISVSSSASICSGQSVALTASGANTYTWSPSSSLSSSAGSSVTATPLATTTYTVTGDLLGCTASSQVTVTVFPVPVITVTPPVTICKGDSTILTASGASAYTWSPATGLSASTGSSVIAIPDSTTIYTVTATNVNGCTASATIMVTVIPSPNVFASNNGPVCIGTPVALNATGANSYAWQPGNMSGASVTVTPSATTIYWVTGTAANGCSAVASTIVTINLLPAVTINLSPVDTQCTSVTSVLLSGGNPAGGTYSGTAVTGNYFYPSLAGTGTHQIIYTYTDLNGCTNADTSSIYVDICTAINNVAYQPAIEIYPNPGSGKFNVSIISETSKDISLKIFDATGRTVFEMDELKKTGTVFHSEIDLGKQAEGIYYLQLASGNEVITGKVIIQR